MDGLLAEDFRDVTVLYIAAAALAGYALMASFALDGPERCNGLPMQRYEPESPAMEPGPAFTLLTHWHEAHTTPAGRIRRFQYSLFRYNPQD